MVTYITAQIIGFLGYLFFTTAPNFKNQKHIIQMDAVACVFLCTQWILLNQPTLLVLNILNITVSLFVLLNKNPAINRIMMVAFYPIGCCALLSVSHGSIIDGLCIIAFCALVRAKSSQTIMTFRSFSILAGIAFTICGGLAMSLPATLFNMAFVLIHIRKILEVEERPSKVLFQN